MLIRGYLKQVLLFQNAADKIKNRLQFIISSWFYGTFKLLFLMLFLRTQQAFSFFVFPTIYKNR
jgi:hypothetical protein